jgi:hypothetical protein
MPWVKKLEIRGMTLHNDGTSQVVVRNRTGRVLNVGVTVTDLGKPDHPSYTLQMRGGDTVPRAPLPAKESRSFDVLHYTPGASIFTLLALQNHQQLPIAERRFLVAAYCDDKTVRREFLVRPQDNTMVLIPVD